MTKSAHSGAFFRYLIFKLYISQWVYIIIGVITMYRDGPCVNTHRDSYGIREDWRDPTMPSAKAGDKFPEGGVSGVKPKYSSGRDPMIGGYRGNGLVNDDANETTSWSDSDMLETGLSSRQPI